MGSMKVKCLVSFIYCFVLYCKQFVELFLSHLLGRKNIHGLKIKTKKIIPMQIQNSQTSTDNINISPKQEN